MADKPTETPAVEKDAPATETPAAEPVASKSGGGFKAWLPLIVTVATMPALAYAMTAFVLAPKLQRAIVNTSVESTAGTSEAAPEKTSGGTESSENKAKGGKQAKVTVPLGKVLVNISGSMGTRYLMANLTLVGASADFKEKVESNKDQLLDVASGTLGAKSISDLEKQGARNMIRSELLMAFNGAIGDGAVRDIYITEFAIQ